MTRYALITLSIFGIILSSGCHQARAQLFMAEAYSEGSCIKPPPPKNQIDANWLVTQKTFYVPLASQSAFHRFAETFISRVGVSEDDIHSMCLTIDMVSSGPGLNMTNTGFDLRDFRQTCQAGDVAGHFFCVPVQGSAGTNPPRTGKADYHIASTDNNSFLFIVRCIDGFFRDYMLLTTKPAISQDIYTKAVQTARELGFDERRVEVMPYDACLRTDRFISAVNVAPTASRVPVPTHANYAIPPFSNAPYVGSNDLRGAGHQFNNQPPIVPPFNNQPGPFPGPYRK